MGSVQIFSLVFSGLKLAVSRSFDGAYHLKAGDYTVTMTPETAGALAGGGKRIRDRAKIASYYKREMQAGATFRRSMLAVDGRTANIEFGVVDDGAGIYLEVGATRMTLTDVQAQTLLALLDQLGADVDTVASAVAGPPVPNFGVAEGMRGLGVPRWARDDQW